MARKPFVTAVSAVVLISLVLMVAAPAGADTALPRAPLRKKPELACGSAEVEAKRMGEGPLAKAEPLLRPSVTVAVCCCVHCCEAIDEILATHLSREILLGLGAQHSFSLFEFFYHLPECKSHNIIIIMFFFLLFFLLWYDDEGKAMRCGVADRNRADGIGLDSSCGFAVASIPPFIIIPRFMRRDDRFHVCLVDKPDRVWMSTHKYCFLITVDPFTILWCPIIFLIVKDTNNFIYIDESKVHYVNVHTLMFIRVVLFCLFLFLFFNSFNYIRINRIVVSFSFSPPVSILCGLWVQLLAANLAPTAVSPLHIAASRRKDHSGRNRSSKRCIRESFFSSDPSTPSPLLVTGESDKR
eukprot:gene2296-1436_t